MRRVLLVLCVGLLVPSAAHAATADGTGRLLVTLKPGAAAAPAPHAVAAAAGARQSGFSVPQIRLVTVASRPGESLRALAARLRADPRVASVAPERRAGLRFQPNDPALSTPETAKDTAPGTPVEWWAARAGFIQAWDISQGAGATVAVIDTGAEITHPELASRVAALQTFDAARSPAGLDTIGHGTHVASLACAAGNNGIGLAGAGLGCRLLVIKSDFSDSSVAASIVWAVDHHADAINMSFGTAPGATPSLPVVNAIDYAVAHGVVLVAAAADDPIEDQRYPASALQPTGTGPDIGAGRGLSVTAADFQDRRAPFAGRGSQISIAAYGHTAATTTTGRGALRRVNVGAQRARHRRARRRSPVRVPHDVRRRRPLRLPRGHLDGGADGRRRRGARAPPEPGHARGRDRARAQADRAAPAGHRMDAGARVGHLRCGHRARRRPHARPPVAAVADTRAPAPDLSHRADAALARGRRAAPRRRRVRRRRVPAVALG